MRNGRSSRERKTEHNLSRWRLWWIIGLVALNGCSGSLPAELAGTWTTGDQRYTDRSLQITSDTITFVTDEENQTVGSIRKVQTIKRESIMIVKISYIEKDNDIEIVDLVYSPEKGGTLWFKNQPKVVWEKINR